MTLVSRNPYDDSIVCELAHDDDTSLEAKLSAAVAAGCSKVDLRRIDRDGDDLHAGYLVEVSSSDAAGALVQAVRNVLPNARVHLIERDSLE